MINTTYPKAPLFAGLKTTVGGAAEEDFTINGVVAGDVVQVTLATEGAVPVTVKRAIAAADKVTVEFSADPDADHVINVTVFKAEA